MTKLQMIRAAMRLRNVTQPEKIVLVQLSSVANRHGLAKISQSRVSDYASLPERTTKRAFAELEKSGYIKRSRKTQKLTGLRLVDETTLLFAKAAFFEPTIAKRKNANLAPWHGACVAPPIYNKKHPILAEAFKLIEGGKK